MKSGLIAIFVCLGSITFAQGDHIISGEFDNDGPVRVVAVAMNDTIGCHYLHRETYRDSYTFKIPALPGISVFFITESQTKMLFIPHTSDGKTHFHFVDVLFKKKSSYLIYQSHPKRKDESVVLN